MSSRSQQLLKQKLIRGRILLRLRCPRHDEMAFVPQHVGLFFQLDPIDRVMDAMPGQPDGLVPIHLSTGLDTVDLSVADNGTGIPYAIQDKVWEPFFSTKGKHGNGLGLDLVKRLVEAQHGQIQMLSTPGQGTEFTISFPIIASPLEADREILVPQ